MSPEVCVRRSSASPGFPTPSPDADSFPPQPQVSHVLDHRQGHREGGSVLSHTRTFLMTLMFLESRGNIVSSLIQLLIMVASGCAQLSGLQGAELLKLQPWGHQTSPGVRAVWGAAVAVLDP